MHSFFPRFNRNLSNVFEMAEGELCIEPAAQKPLIGELPPPDVMIVTSGGSRIPAHGSVLGKMSPVLDGILDKPCKQDTGSERLILIPGVPCEAVAVFVRFLYSNRCAEKDIEKYGVHLLALSHAYMVPNLKQRCARALTNQLTFDNVVDKLKLARLCDAPYLSLKCMKLIVKHFKEVEKTEGWMFLQCHDPWLELEILQFMDETATRKRRVRKLRKAQSMYLQLSEAMDCLEHICTEGCTTVGPHHVEPKRNKAPCSKFSTCQGLQLLIRHFAQCKKRVNGGCLRCKRMWQLLQLHSSICDRIDDCQVPLCRQFKQKAQQGKQQGDPKWKLLVEKVLAAKAMSALLLSKKPSAKVSGWRDMRQW